MLVFRKGLEFELIKSLSVLGYSIARADMDLSEPDAKLPPCPHRNCQVRSDDAFAPLISWRREVRSTAATQADALVAIAASFVASSIVSILRS